MSRLQLWKEDPVRKDGSVTSGVTIEDDRGERRSLWFRVPERFADRLTDTCNPFVTDSMIRSMRTANTVTLSFIEILETAQEKGIRASWISALDTAVKRNRKQLKGWRRQVREMRKRYAIKTRLKENFSKK